VEVTPMAWMPQRTKQTGECEVKQHVNPISNPAQFLKTSLEKNSNKEIKTDLDGILAYLVHEVTTIPLAARLALGVCHMTLRKEDYELVPVSESTWEEAVEGSEGAMPTMDAFESGKTLLFTAEKADIDVPSILVLPIDIEGVASALEFFANEVDYSELSMNDQHQRLSPELVRTDEKYRRHYPALAVINLTPGHEYETAVSYEAPEEVLKLHGEDVVTAYQNPRPSDPWARPAIVMYNTEAIKD
jgi:hypothetical protein